MGETGLGKSSVAAAVVTYMNDRRMFDDGIVYLKPMHGRTDMISLTALSRLILPFDTPFVGLDVLFFLLFYTLTA